VLVRLFHRPVRLGQVGCHLLKEGRSHAEHSFATVLCPASIKPLRSKSTLSCHGRSTLILR